MLPALLGMIAGGAMMGLGAVQGMAPSAGGAIETILTPESTCAKQREFRASPTLELSADALTNARLKGLITHDAFKVGLARNGVSSGRADTLLEVSKNLLSLEELSTAYYKGDIDKKTYLKKCQRIGLDNNEAALYLTSTRSIPDALALITGLWRGKINTDTFYKKMLALGYTKEDANIVLQSQYYLPSHDDLIRFQVRDVYNKPIVEKYGYDEEFPESIKDDAAKIGMDVDTMRKYWRAHWELPSPTAGYMMLQRLDPEVLVQQGEKYREMGLDPNDLKTDVDTLKQLLKVADYPKYWRDRLVAISYDPITRVDLKRIYTMGLCSDEFVVNTMREHGYTKKDAELILNFYKETKHGSDKQLSTATLVKAWQYGRITRTELKTRLMELNYTDKDADIFIKAQEDVLDQKDFNDTIKLLQTQYALGNVTEDSIKQALSNEGLSDKKQRLILSKFEDARYKKQKVPAVKDLGTFFNKGIMDETAYREGLKAAGITAKYRDYYVTLNKPAE